MTASQLKRIRAKLARAAQLTAEAHDIAKSAHADSTLKGITARAADDMTGAQRSMKFWDDEYVMIARSLAESLKDSS